MKKLSYVGMIQRKIIKYDRLYLQARRAGNTLAAELAKQAADEYAYELKQAEFMEKN